MDEMPLRQILKAGLYALILAGSLDLGLAQAESASPDTTGNSEFAAPALNQDEIHHAYEDGSFEKALQMLEGFVESHPNHAKSDSIFIAKHFAVIYSADPATRTMGKTYMVRLLQLKPTATLKDMFVSDEIERQFEKVRTELNIPTPLAEDAGASHLTPSNTSPSESQQSKTNAKYVTRLYWLAGGSALAIGVGAAFYWLATNESSGKDTTYVLPH